MVCLKVYRVVATEFEKIEGYKLGVKSVLSARYLPEVSSGIPDQMHRNRPAQYELLCEMEDR